MEYVMLVIIMLLIICVYALFVIQQLLKRILLCLESNAQSNARYDEKIPEKLAVIQNALQQPNQEPIIYEPSENNEQVIDEYPGVILKENREQICVRLNKQYNRSLYMLTCYASKKSGCAVPEADVFRSLINLGMTDKDKMKF